MENVTFDGLFELSRKSTESVTIETTITSGLEKVAEDECYETFGKHTPVVAERGRIYFNIPKTVVCKVFSMRSIDNVYIIVHLCNCTFVSEKNEDLLILKQLYSEINWKKSLSVWKDVYKFSGTLYPTKEEYEACLNSFVACNSNNPKKCKGEKKIRENSSAFSSNSSDIDNTKYNFIDFMDGTEKNNEMLKGTSNSDSEAAHYLNQVSLEEDNVESIHKVDPCEAVCTIPTFRVTAKRVGSHSFTSEDVAKMFGAVIQEDFLWIVDLTNFNMEIMTNTIDSNLIVSVALTKFSLHKRNLTSFGLTSLRATICYSLIKLALPEVGDILVDPLAGSGSIPIEGALAFPGSFFLAGDNQENACNICKKNLNQVFSAGNRRLPANLLKWDALKLPFKNSTVDIIVTDMPFGKRSGSKKSNKVLYPGVLKEFGRVVRKGSGKAVLLTADRRSLEMAYSMTKNLWNISDRRCVNVGGLKAVVFLLLRTVFD